MWKIIKTRIKQGYRTLRYPKEEPVFPERFRGKPVITDPNNLDQSSLNKEFDPTGALSVSHVPAVDLGKLLFNEDVKKACPQGNLVYSQDYRLAVSKREDLMLKDNELKLASAFQEKTKKIFGRSLKL